ncbi:hypothetical protein CMI42_02405 [Candidatus Pacearchaeota archaeon]|nr:hypothetical protein [Candidatus Pacearchaeota archaeon]|tara:strand:+ start:1058 stop:1471 length:414 start_codon:yes stop_codon:yes gene_type:complete
MNESQDTKDPKQIYKDQIEIELRIYKKLEASSIERYNQLDLDDQINLRNLIPKNKAPYSTSVQESRKFWEGILDLGDLCERISALAFMYTRCFGHDEYSEEILERLEEIEEFKDQSRRGMLGEIAEYLQELEPSRIA